MRKIIVLIAALMGVQTLTIAQPYLELAGGTLTGSLTGTSGTFSGSVTAPSFISNSTSNAVLSNTTGTTDRKHIALASTGGSGVFGLESSAGNSILTGGSAYALVIGTGSTGNSVQIGTNNIVRYTIDQSTGNNTWTSSGTFGGNLGIGTTTIPTGYKLAVNGKVIAEAVKVQLNGSWPDYVFHKNYPLKPLSEVEKFIQTNNHLPEIPSSDEVKKDGLNLGEMNAKLLQKIEELTLYMIEIKKENEQQQKEINQLKPKR